MRQSNGCVDNIRQRELACAKSPLYILVKDVFREDGNDAEVLCLCRGTADMDPRGGFFAFSPVDISFAGASFDRKS